MVRYSLFWKTPVQKKAIPAYKKAFSLEPNATQIHVKLGDAYADIYQFSAAIPSYQKAVELEPNWAEAYYQLGTILAKRGSIEEALQYL